jgi:hypothetical protein
MRFSLKYRSLLYKLYWKKPEKCEWGMGSEILDFRFGILD